MRRWIAWLRNWPKTMMIAMAKFILSSTNIIIYHVRKFSKWQQKISQCVKKSEWSNVYSNYLNLFTVLDGECSVNNSSHFDKNHTIEGFKNCVKYIENWAEQCYNVNPDEPIFSFNVDCLLAKECMCTYDNHAANMIFSFGPYLYPFSIEFSILVGKEVNSF